MGIAVFNECKNLKNVVWNASLSEIPDWTFAATSFESFEFPKNITRVGECAFLQSKLIGDIVLPETVRMVGWNTFNGTNIQSVTFKGDVNKIAEGAFTQCPELAKVRFEGRTGDFGKNAFLDCPKLATVEIADLNSWATSEFANAAANPISVSRSLMVNGEPLTQLELYLPDENVGSYAFAGLKGLKLARVTGKGLNPYAFSSNPDLTDLCINVEELAANAVDCAPTNIYAARKTPASALENSFASCAYTGSYLYVPTGTKEVYKADTPCWSRFLDIVECSFEDIDKIFGESGLDEVEAVGDGGEAEWYDLRGVRVDPENLAPGLYIKRQGSKAEKVIVKN